MENEKFKQCFSEFDSEYCLLTTLNVVLRLT